MEKLDCPYCGSTNAAMAIDCAKPISMSLSLSILMLISPRLVLMLPVFELIEFVLVFRLVLLVAIF